MIKAKNLSLKLNGKEILRDISTNIENGKITAILGPNGAGKSTLLKCLTGSEKADKGKIELDGVNLQDYSLTDLANKRAVLSQSIPINFPFNVFEIVMMGRNQYMDVNNNHKIANESLSLVDASNLKDRVFPTLSGGEQQRVQFARVLSQIWQQENAHLFLDEPTSALDLKHQHQIFALLKSLVKEYNFSVCVILHDLYLAKKYTDEVILMKDGEIFAQGETKKILNSKNIYEVFEVNFSFG